MVKISQNNEMPKRDITLSRFISTVNTLVYPKDCGNFFLLHILILPQIP